MKKKIKSFYQTSLFSMFVIATCLFSFSASAVADIRSDAKDAVFRLRQTTTSHKTPDELASIETTFSVAEQYFKLNNRELSEKYYLLTIQKASITIPPTVDKPVLNAKFNSPVTNNTTIVSKTPVKTITVIQQQTSQTTSIPVLNSSIKPGAVDSASQLPLHGVSKTLVYESETQNEEGEEQDDFLAETVSSELLIGNPSIYTVIKHDNIRLVAAKLGVSRQHLIEINHLNPNSVLKPGQHIKYNNRRIIPRQIKNGIVINIPEKTLYFFKDGKLNRSIPVALGVPTKTKKYDWKTPTGKFKIVAKQKNPTWHVPISIQEEMEDAGKDVITSIPPGPANPLGKYAFKTSLPGIMIHSTTKPASIYSFASHGCIRVYPQHMEDFFNAVKVNTTGEIIYRPVKLADTESGRIFLEVHRDVYGKSAELSQVTKKLIEKQNLSNRVNWKKVKAVVNQKTGIAEDITL